MGTAVDTIRNISHASPYRAITNKPPLKDFWPPDFPRGFYYSSKIQPKILLAFIILKKNSPAARFYYSIFLKTPNLSSPEDDF